MMFTKKRNDALRETAQCIRTENTLWRQCYISFSNPK